MPPVGRPRVTTNNASRPPVSEIGVADPLNYGVSLDPVRGGVAPWRQWFDSVEYVPELRWPQSTWIYDEMRTDSQLAALLTAVMYGITQLRFILDPNGARDSLVKEVSQDLNLTVKGDDAGNLGRMKRRFSHRKFLTQAMLSPLYGHMYFEINGEIVDGKWRLRKLAPRMPRTIQKINVADDGGLVSIVQWMGNGLNGPMPGVAPEIPVDNLVAFIFQQEGFSWAGRSMMRDCYKDWLIKDQLMRIEAINHERAGGVPWAEAPMGATVDEIADLDMMMRQFRIGDTAGGALPFGSKLQIAKGTGSDIDRTIQRYDESMARRFLLMLANLAQGGNHVGSYALADTFEDFFLVGQRHIAQWYCDVVNEHIIEDIADWNYGVDEEFVPKLTWERTSEDSLGVEQLSLLVQRGIIIVDDEIENAVRYKYQFPKRGKPRADDIITPGGPKQPTQEQEDANPNLSTDKPPANPGAGATSPGAPSKSAPAKASFARLFKRKPDVMASGAMPESALTTVKDVPIMRAGIQYELSTGSTTFTPDDLADAVRAATEDKSIPQPRLKLGHIDPRYNDMKVYDATPSFGVATNLRLSDNGMTVFADYVGVPEWLAPILPAAFPNRSVEGFWDVESHLGKSYRFVLSACSLLGVQWPGITVLEDLPHYYGREMPGDVVLAPELAAAMSGREGNMKLFKREKSAASANLDDVRRSFYRDYVPGNPDAESWWIQAVLIDPNEAIIEDDGTKKLYKLPISADDAGEIIFGEPVAVDFPSYIPQTEESYAAAASHVAATLAIGRTVLASWQTRAESSPDNNGGAMEPKELRKQLGLPEDASDEQVQTALIDKAGLKATEPVVVQEPAGAPSLVLVPTPAVEPVKPVAVAPEKDDDGKPVVPAIEPFVVPAGMKLVDEATFDAVAQNSQIAASFVQESKKEKIGAAVMAAIGDGRIVPASKDHWTKLLETDPNAPTLLASLAPNTVPVEMRGHGGGGTEGDGVNDQMTDEVVNSWSDALFPEVRNWRQTEAARASGALVPHQRVTADAAYRR